MKSYALVVLTLEIHRQRITEDNDLLFYPSVCSHPLCIHKCTGLASFPDHSLFSVRARKTWFGFVMPGQLVPTNEWSQLNSHFPSFLVCIAKVVMKLSLLNTFNHVFAHTLCVVTLTILVNILTNSFIFSN